jgi:hypothetical protein
MADASPRGISMKAGTLVPQQLCSGAAGSTRTEREEQTR